jgi:hypothetical protein
MEPPRDLAEAIRRLGMARTEWSRAVSLLEGRKFPSPRYSDESKLIVYCRKRMNELEAMREAVTDFVLVAAVVMWPELAVKVGELAPTAQQVADAFNRLKTFAKLPDDPPCPTT